MAPKATRPLNRLAGTLAWSSWGQGFRLHAQDSVNLPVPWPSALGSRSSPSLSLNLSTQAELHLPVWQMFATGHQEPCLTQCRTPLLIETVNSVHHNSSEGTRSRRPCGVGRVEGDWKMATACGHEPVTLCIIPEYLCHMEGTWCRVRRSAHVLWKEEEQVKKSISSKRDDQTRVSVGTGNPRKPHISQLTSASLGGRGLTRLGIVTHSSKKHFLISALTTTILLLWAMPSARCWGYHSKKLTPCPQETYGIGREIDTAKAIITWCD